MYACYLIVSPGSILSRYQAVRLYMNLVLECVLKCFFVGGWVLPELQQICGVQFGSGANPGGHVTVSFGATVIFCVDGPLECYATPTSHISGCVWVIGALQSGRIWFATTRATVFELLNWKICQVVGLWNPIGVTPKVPWVVLVYTVLYGQACLG